MVLRRAAEIKSLKKKQKTLLAGLMLSKEQNGFRHVPRKSVSGHGRGCDRAGVGVAAGSRRAARHAKRREHRAEGFNTLASVLLTA